MPVMLVGTVTEVGEARGGREPGEVIVPVYIAAGRDTWYTFGPDNGYAQGQPVCVEGSVIKGTKGGLMFRRMGRATKESLTHLAGLVK